MLLDDLKGIQAKMGHDPLGCDWTNPFDESAAKIFLQTCQGRWFGFLSMGYLKLLTIFGMLSPESCEAQSLSCGNRGKTAHDGNEIARRCHLESCHAIARFFG